MKNPKHKIKASQVSVEQITADRLDTIISENTYTIIDVRGEKGIATQGSIPRAIHIPLDAMDKSIDRNHEAYNPIFNDQGPFLFCCTGGVMSYMAAIKAKEKGINNVYNLAGGHSAWLKHKAAADLR